MSFNKFIFVSQPGIFQAVADHDIPKIKELIQCWCRVDCVRVGYPRGRSGVGGGGRDNNHLGADQGFRMIFHRLEKYHGIACVKFGENSKV